MPGKTSDRKIKFRLNALIDQEPVSASIDKIQREFTGCIQALMRALDASPTGRSLLQAAAAENVSVGLDFLLEPSGCFFYPAQKHFDFGYQPDILQKTEKGQGRYLVSFISGLRRAWHQRQNNGADISLRPEDFLRHFRCTEADIESVTQLIGWELRVAGHSFLWRHLLAGQNGDMAAAFESCVTEDPGAQFDGRALKAAFGQWFVAETRVSACDSQGLEIMDMAILQSGRIGKIGALPLRQESLQGLGSLPAGGNYLSGDLLKDTQYGGLYNSLNRTHLKYIEQDINQHIENKENIIL
jgi:hypothetical protein